MLGGEDQALSLRRLGCVVEADGPIDNLLGAALHGLVIMICLRYSEVGHAIWIPRAAHRSIIFGAPLRLVAGQTCFCDAARSMLRLPQARGQVGAAEELIALLEVVARAVDLFLISLVIGKNPVDDLRRVIHDAVKEVLHDVRHLFRAIDNAHRKLLHDSKHSPKVTLGRILMQALPCRCLHPRCHRLLKSHVRQFDIELSTTAQQRAAWQC
mmetsp:Transcript_115343/g.288233  ORF Transcript_115343/g.288233 Transcript_115343/m.288233 type:complete len:212 (-) Transcript_115343:266-901(-)